MAIKKLEDDRYQVDVVRPNGTRARRIFDKRRDAIAFEAQIRKEKYEAKLVRTGLKKERYLMEQAIRDFETSKKSLRASSIKRYRSILHQLRIFCDACGVTYVDEFSPDHATWLHDELVREKVDPKGSTKRILTPKAKTVNLFLQTIKAIFTNEVAKRHIDRNPFLHVKNLRVEKKSPEYFTKEELKAFFQQPMNESYRNAFFGLLFTGMRFAEMANLMWEDVDLRTKHVHVRSKGAFKTKTHNAERKIPMNKRLVDIITEIRANPKSATYVFCSPTGRIMRERSMLHVCKKIATRAGITSRAFLHKFRHTFATHLVQRRQPLESIKELLGHASIRETDEVYAHNKSDHMSAEVSMLDDLLD